MGSLDSLEAVSKSIIQIFHFIYVQSRDQRHQTNSHHLLFENSFYEMLWDFFFIKFSAALQSTRVHYDYFPFRNVFGPSARTERVSLDL